MAYALGTLAHSIHLRRIRPSIVPYGLTYNPRRQEGRGFRNREVRKSILRSGTLASGCLAVVCMY
eukprot:1394296-Amorphochlora_amoeboformis.AAC.1